MVILPDSSRSSEGVSVTKQEFQGSDGTATPSGAIVAEEVWGPGYYAGATSGAAAGPIGEPTGRLSAGRVYDVLLISPDAVLSDRLLAHFLEQRRFKLRLLRGRIGALEEELGEVRLPDIAILDFGGAGAADVDTLESLKKSRLSKVPIVAISDPLDQRVMRGLMQIKVDDWLPAGCSASEIEESCERAMRARPAGEASSRSTCLSFFPAHGGCGNTTLCIQTAILIASKMKEPQSACLVDLNFQDGAVADYLDLTPAFELSELAKIAERLDRQLLDVMLSRHGSGLAVLAAPHAPGQHIEIHQELIASILELLSETFRYLIVDLPKSWQLWTDNVLWGSDRVFVVSGFTVPALRYARLLADTIATRAGPMAEVSVIVNKFHEPLIGAGLTRKDAESILEGRLGGYIPDLHGLVDEAINRGLPLSELRAGNKIEKKLSEIVGRDLSTLHAQKR